MIERLLHKYLIKSFFPIRFFIRHLSSLKNNPVMLLKDTFIFHEVTSRYKLQFSSPKTAAYQNIYRSRALRV